MIEVFGYGRLAQGAQDLLLDLVRHVAGFVGSDRLAAQEQVEGLIHSCGLLTRAQRPRHGAEGV